MRRGRVYGRRTSRGRAGAAAAAVLAAASLLLASCSRPAPARVDTQSVRAVVDVYAREQAALRTWQSLVRRWRVVSVEDITPNPPDPSIRGEQREYAVRFEGDSWLFGNEADVTYVFLGRTGPTAPWTVLQAGGGAP